MFSRQKIRQNLTCFLLILTLCISTAHSSELVIATTLAREGVQHLIDEWHKQPNSAAVTTLNRTSDSIQQLFSTERAKEVDLILSSSPMLFDNLQQKDGLAELPPELTFHQQFVPPMLQNKVLAFSLSGYGMLLNTEVLDKQSIQIPRSWQDLTRSELQGLVIISSPTRSDTNHIMLETILQQFGWDQGWALLNQIMANVGTISSRSFGVVDKVQAGLGGVGITIDNYANLFTAKRDSQSPLIFRYFEHFTLSPTFIALNKTSSNHSQAMAFIRFLLSQQGQTALNHSKMGKIPITPLSPESANYDIQQKLFKQPQIDYQLMLKRDHLVKLLFEQQITYRLNQLQENWQLLRQKETALGKILPELRDILNQLPVSAEQAEDEQYLTTFNQKQRLLDWQAFFISQQLAFISALEKLQ
ncbi:pesticidal protein Cry1Aa [Actinobacillus succinogenes]|uniref:Phosphoglycerate transport regulatory protein n=1 Tax=Actinobacillus succinogenes (strain ATCC 55618 / DSM 22257 / CCUG 43843 / 130Z) TaxID=339671 RepID=A6VQ24_ACTSZ|nr:ABC transporter substrate-binding protein [Actinobacillus succinogenes]ABR75071.1 phosphoglycerate transport regulatory protein [Actinobacillus succinogenes 130Z]PHI40524.1 pesticidal protein Cry1Aa [Actinobacillus succinogenes]